MADLLACKPLVARVQWDLGISDKLAFAWCPTDRAVGRQYDLCTMSKGAASVLTNASYTAGKFGLAENFVAASSTKHTWPDKPAWDLNSTGFTICLLIKPLGGAASLSPFGKISSVGWLIRQNTAFDILMDNAGAFKGATANYVQGKWYQLFFQFDKTNVWSIMNGVRSANTAATAPGADATGLQVGTASTFYTTSEIAGAFIWRRVLGKSEINALQRDPWLPVRPGGVMAMSDLSGQGFLGSAAGPGPAAAPVLGFRRTALCNPSMILGR